MSYRYETQRAELFTEHGAKTLLTVRDNAKRLLNTAGAFMASHAFDGADGDTWTMLAALDYLVERGEIVRVAGGIATWGQCQVFTAPRQPRL
jgi:hypothetical protein